jgi:hypothetical protein
MSKEAMKLALEALITINNTIYVNSQQEAAAVYKANDAIKALREALADQPAQRKPLTYEEIENLLPDDDTPMSLGEAFVKFTRLVEAAHGIKENT